MFFCTDRVDSERNGDRMVENLIGFGSGELRTLLGNNGYAAEFGSLRRRELRECADYKKFGRWASSQPIETELVDRDINADMESLIYAYVRNRATSIIGNNGEGRKRKLRGVLDFHRGRVDVRGINPRATRRRMEVDIGGGKGTWEQREYEGIPILAMGRPMFQEPRTDVEVGDFETPAGASAAKGQFPMLCHKVSNLYHVEID